MLFFFCVLEGMRGRELALSDRVEVLLASAISASRVSAGCLFGEPAPRFKKINREDLKAVLVTKSSFNIFSLPRADVGCCLVWFRQRRLGWLGNAKVCAGRCVAWGALQLGQAPACPWGSTGVGWLGCGVSALATVGVSSVICTWTGRSGDIHM